MLSREFQVVLPTPSILRDSGVLSPRLSSSRRLSKTSMLFRKIISVLRRTSDRASLLLILRKLSALLEETTVIGTQRCV